MADFTYDILVNIIGEDAARDFARDASNLGLEIQKLKRMSRGVGGSLVEETQFAIKGLNRAQRDAGRLLGEYHRYALSQPGANGAFGQYQESYTDATNAGMARRLRFVNTLNKLDQQRIRNAAKLAELDTKNNANADYSQLTNKFKINDALRRQIDAEERLLDVQQNQRNTIQNLINESRHYHSQAIKYAQMEADARRAGDNEAARRHRAHFQRYIADSKRLAAEAERTANRQVRANEKVQRSQKSVIAQLVHFKHALWAVAALVSAGAITNAFERVGRNIWDAYRASVEFNAEAVKASTLFASLGTGDIKNFSPMQIEAGVPGVTKAMKDQLAAANGFGKEMTQLMREASAKTGQDFAEIMGVAKAALPDLKNKMDVSDSEFLKRGDEVKRFTKDLIELSAVMKMVDEKNRKMSFQAIGLLETFTGTAGDKSKGNGAANFLSLLRRANIKIRPEDQKGITDAINLKKPLEAMRILKEALARAGVDVKNIDTLLSRDRSTNVSATAAAFKALGGSITVTAERLEKNFFQSIRMNLAQLMADDKFKAMLKGWDQAVAGLVDGVLQDITKAMDWLVENPERLDSMFKSMVQTLDNIYTITKDLIILGGEFFSGFFGQETSEGFDFASSFDRVHQTMIAIRPMMREWGANAKIIFDSFNTIGSMTFTGLMAVLHSMSAVVSAIKTAVQYIAENAGYMSMGQLRPDNEVGGGGGGGNSPVVKSGARNGNGQQSVVIQVANVNANTTGSLLKQTIQAAGLDPKFILPPGS